MICVFCGRPARGHFYFGRPACVDCMIRQVWSEPSPILPPDDGRDHFNAGEDDWDRDADSRQADREVGDE